MNQEKIGKFIALCRKNKNLTQEELATRLNVTSKSISRWENGKTMPDYSLLNPLCKELDITINELLSGEKIKPTNYEIKYNENLNEILKEYYKLKKQKQIIKNILLIVSLTLLVILVRLLLVLGIVSLSFLTPEDNITGINNYHKEYYIEKYRGDLDSNLMIFPNDTSKLINSTFSSSLKTNFFDTDGYIILKTKYHKEDFDNEINRLSNLKMTINETCYSNSKQYTNYIKYDNISYEYPAYITIDGFDSTYEYALVNEDTLEIIYLYLSSPNISDNKYREYLKKDQSIYAKTDTINSYSIYNHSFNNGKSFMEYSDCK